jgi:hypothetical protein
MVWVILGPLSLYIAQDVALDVSQKFTAVAIPALFGALLRIPLGVLSDHIGPKHTGLLAQLVVMATLAYGWLVGLHSILALEVFGVLLGMAGGLKLLDLGVARLPGIETAPEEYIPGTPSYLAPEMFDGNADDERTDVYALGVTLYRMFSGHYPYGETEAFARPRFGRRQPLAHYRPDLPAWVDAVLDRATAVQADERYAHVADLVSDLEAGLSGAGGTTSSPCQPLYARNPLRFWQSLSLLLLIALLISLALRG